MKTEEIKTKDSVKNIYQEPTREEVLESIRQGLKEVELIKQGKLKTTPLKDFLDEL